MLGYSYMYIKQHDLGVCAICEVARLHVPTAREMIVQFMSYATGWPSVVRKK